MSMVIVGIDEVGRGCWAGPLVAGAVILGESISKLTDSKLLSKKQREDLDKQIRATALSIGLGWVTSQEVDDIGVTAAVGLAMKRALKELTHDYDRIIIDGNINYFLTNPKAQAVIKADLSVPCVSAASIIAKVARDTHMLELSRTSYPGYGFEQHVGYGTKQHLAALKILGVSHIHRKSYKPIKALLQ
jgi:ribonuclease HII